MWQKLQTWKEKLSQEGKEVLLKVVALSIPTYVMSCFKLPDTSMQRVRISDGPVSVGSKMREEKDLLDWLGKTL